MKGGEDASLFSSPPPTPDGAPPHQNGGLSHLDGKEEFAADNAGSIELVCVCVVCVRCVCVCVEMFMLRAKYVTGSAYWSRMFHGAL